MEECTKLAVRYEVPIEVSHIACGIRRPHPVGLNPNRQFKLGLLGPVELGHQSTIPRLGCFGLRALPFLNRSGCPDVHEVDRDIPLPSPLTAEVVAVTSPEVATTGRLSIGCPKPMFNEQGVRNAA